MIRVATNDETPSREGNAIAGLMWGLGLEALVALVILCAVQLYKLFT